MAINLDHVTEQITVTDEAANASLTVNPKGTGAFNIAAGSGGLNLSNGGTVTAVTKVSDGTNYTTLPTVAIAAPTTAGGVQAVLQLYMYQVPNTIASGGTGYTVGNILTIVGGTPVSSPTVLTVTSVSSGVITGVARTDFNAYTALPTNPVSVTGGSGSGATFNLIWGVGSIIITNAGSGYVEQPTITFSGGGGSGAAAYATLGSGVAALRGLTSNFAIYTPAGEHTRFVDNGQGNTYWTVYSNPTLISPNGSAANIPAQFSSKGASGINLYTNTGNQLQAVVTHTASAVNYVNMTGAATGSGPTISAQGSDTNADLNATSKGTGVINLNTGAGTQVRIIDSGGTAVNRIHLQGQATGFLPVIASRGSDTNLGMSYSTQGTGGHDFYTNGTSFTQQFKVTHTASAVNYLQVAGGVSGDDPSLSSAGSQSRNIRYRSGSGASHLFETGTYANLQAAVSNTASAVNWVQVTGAATSGIPAISAQGSDADIDIAINAKNNRSVRLSNGNGLAVRFYGGINSMTLAGSGAGVAPELSVFGSDTNIDLKFVTKGTGSHVFNTGNGKQFQISDATTASGTYTLASRDITNNVQLLGVAGGAANFGLYAANGGSVRIYTQSGLLEQQLVIPPTTSAVNYVQIKGGATGIAPLIQSLGSDTNIPLVLQPKGTGALQAQQTDSTATGGNARGANATDFQTSRSAAGQVASGPYAVISGGIQNTSSSNFSVVCGGTGNIASGGASVVIGGQNSQATNTYAIAGGGGNQANGNYSIALGGYGLISAGFYSTIVGGQQNSATSGSAVTTQSATMNGTIAVTLAASNASIKVGQYITGTYTAGLTYVAAVSGTSLTLSQAASGSGTATLSFYTPHGVVVGGGNNTATGSYSFIGGGGDAGTAGNRNVASGDWSVVGGGQRNVASGLGSFVGGGGTTNANTASGENSVICGGGNFGPQTASGPGAAVLGGWANNATGAGAICAGIGGIANGDYSSTLGGSYGTARGIAGYTAFSASSAPMGTVFTNQTALLILARQTTNATPTVLTSTTAGASTNNQVILPNNSAYFFTGEVVAGVTGGGDTKGWKIEGVIKRGANAASTALVGTPTVTSMYADVGAATWTIAVTADTTNGGLAVTFTGQLATTIRCVAQIRTTEMTF